MQISSKVSSAVAVNLSVIPPNGNPDGDEAEETHSGKAKKCDSKRKCNIEQPETGKKRQEQYCGYNEFPTLQFINGEVRFYRGSLIYCSSIFQTVSGYSDL